MSPVGIGNNVESLGATLLTMVGYAQALGAKELRIMNPINEDVRYYCERFGLAYINKSGYLYVRLLGDVMCDE